MNNNNDNQNSMLFTNNFSKKCSLKYDNSFLKYFHGLGLFYYLLEEHKKYY